MNPQNRKQIIIVAVLGVVLVGVLIYQVTRPAPGGPKVENTKAPAATGVPAAAAPSAAAHAPAAGATASGGSTQLKHADVDVDGLLAGIQEVNFDYDSSRMPRDPMAPLVGIVAKVQEDGETSTEAAPTATISQLMQKVVSGIVWDKVYPVAIVDNEIVYPGYRYPDGTAVEKIERDRVVFRIGDSLVQVELEEL